MREIKAIVQPFMLQDLLAESLAGQPEQPPLSEWLAEVEDNIHRLRSRVRDGVEG